MEEVLGQLIEFVKTASPFVWQTLVKQVYVDAFGYAVWGIALAIVSFMLWKFQRYCSKELESDDWGFDAETNLQIGMWTSRVIAAMLVVISFGLFVSAFSRIFNPDFYAINYILGQLNSN